ncbi:MAG: DNA gyrase inhibitor YacG [Acidobacteriota bacterium]
MKCPICHQETTWQENPNRPFCSERCKMIDLGKWAEGEYRIEGGPASEEPNKLPPTERNEEEGI